VNAFESNDLAFLQAVLTAQMTEADCISVSVNSQLDVEKNELSCQPAEMPAIFFRNGRFADRTLA
jgi:hypothetical protein